MVGEGESLGAPGGHLSPKGEKAEPQAVSGPAAGGWGGRVASRELGGPVRGPYQPLVLLPQELPQTPANGRQPEGEGPE